MNLADPTGTEAAFISTYSACVDTGGSNCGAILEPYQEMGKAFPLADAAWELDQGNRKMAVGLLLLQVGTGGRGKWSAALLGKAQKTFRAGRIATGHAFASARAALAMMRSGDYSKVALNRTLSKITDGDVASRLRPDVAGVRPDGKVDITEVLSPGQDAAELQAKYSQALGDRMGSFKAVEVTKQMCTGSRIARDTC